jgi:hypothetical protein
MSFVQLIDGMMNNSVPVSLLASWPAHKYTPNAFVKVNNWYLPFENGAGTTAELNGTEDLQLREQMYARILKQIGLA